MRLHRNARTCPQSRELLVNRVECEGWTLVGACRAAGVSEVTGRKWLRRYQREGPAGLLDRSSRPASSPNETPASRVARIEKLRRKRLSSPAIARKLKMAVSTVCKILKQLGLGKLRALEPREPVHRYEWDEPGDLIHVDIKPLARIRQPGHRVTGNRTRVAHGLGYEQVHVVIDDHSRLAYAEVMPDKTARSAIAVLQRALVWFAQHGVTVRRVLSDNGSAYKASSWKAECDAHGIKHKRTRPYRPQTNGKAERFIQTLIREWAYNRTYSSSRYRTQALRYYLRHYNYKRPHGSLEGHPPMSRIPKQRV